MYVRLTWAVSDESFTALLFSFCLFSYQMSRANVAPGIIRDLVSVFARADLDYFEIEFLDFDFWIIIARMYEINYGIVYDFISMKKIMIFPD